jgi:hypothetical protein
MCEHMTIYGSFFGYFYEGHIKYIFFLRNICANIESLIYRKKTVFEFLQHFKICFYAFSMIGLHRPRAKTPSKVQIALTMFGHRPRSINFCSLLKFHIENYAPKKVLYGIIVDARVRCHITKVERRCTSCGSRCTRIGGPLVRATTLSSNGG